MPMIEKNKKLIAPLCIASVVGLVFMIIIIKCPIVYGTVDDRIMRDIASGAYTGTPDPHLIHIGYILGIILSVLYSCMRGFDWYGAIMLVLQAMCLMLIIFRSQSIIKKCENKILISIVILILFAVISMNRVVETTFTIVAGFLGATAIFWLTTSNKKSTDDIVLVILALLTYEVRCDVFYMMVPIAITIYVAKFVDFKNKPHIKKRKLIISAVLVLGIAFFIDKFAYRTPSWESALDGSWETIFDYNNFPEFYENEEFYSSIGIDKNAYLAMHDYNVAAVSTVDSDILKLIADYSLTVHKNNNVLENVKSTLIFLRENMFQKQYILLGSLSAIVAVWLLVRESLKSNKKYLILVIVLLLEQACIWLYLGFKGRMPDRVCYTLYIMLFSSLSGLLMGGIRRINEWKASIILILISSISFGCIFFIKLSSYESEGEARKNWQLGYQKIQSYCQEHPDDFYFIDVTGQALYSDVLTFKRDQSYQNYMTLGDWIAFTPLFYEKLEREDIESITQAIAESAHVYVITGDVKTLDYMTNEIKENYNYFASHIVDVIEHQGCNFYVYSYDVEAKDSKQIGIDQIADINTNSNVEAIGNAIDGAIETAWNSDITNDDIWIEIVFDEEITLNQVQFNILNYGKAPKNLSILASVEGNSWTVLDARHKNNLVYNFDTVKCKYLKFVDSSEHMLSERQWAIEEIDFFSPN